MERDVIRELGGLAEYDLSQRRAAQIRNVALRVLADSTSEPERQWWEKFELPVAYGFAAAQTVWAIVTALNL